MLEAYRPSGAASQHKTASTRLFSREKDNQHEEPLLFAQCAAKELHCLLCSHELEEDSADCLALWVAAVSKVGVLCLERSCLW